MKIKHKILIYNVAALSSSLFAPLLINNTMSISQTKTTTATASVRVSNFCSMTANIQPHSTTLIGGQYQSDIGKTTIQTFCNDPNGYAIYAIGYTGEDAGVAAGTNTVLHSTALGSTYDIVTGIAQSGDTSNWAMKVSSVSGTYEPTILSDDDGPYSDYHTVPSSYTKVVKFNTSTDATIGSSLTTTYATYISSTQPAGTYEGQVKYVLVHPSNSLSPNFNMQNVDEWGPTIAVGEEVTAYDNRDNKSYTVRRMCMESSASSDATWQEKEENCTSDMLWMTQNLDLDLNNTISLTSEDTDLKDVSLAGAYSNGYTVNSDGIIYWTPANSTITGIDTANGKFNGWSSMNASKLYSADPDGNNPGNPWYATGTYFQSNSCYIDNNSQTCNYLNESNAVADAYFRRTPFTINGSHGKIGNYYNWSAAIASNDSSSLTSSTYNNVDNNPQNSICPKGWRLPTISSVAAKNEFALLDSTYNTNHDSNKLDQGLFESPVYMVRSGYVDSDGIVVSAGYDSNYWSSTVDSGIRAYNLFFRSDSIGSNNNSRRVGGRSVRCVSEY